MLSTILSSTFVLCLTGSSEEELLGTFRTRSSRCVGTLKLRTFEEGSWELLLVYITQRSDVIRFLKIEHQCVEWTQVGGG